jgi:phage-related protein
MAFATFNPPIDPSSGGVGRRVDYNVLAAEFGDGYSQPVGNGVNYRRRKLSLSWDTLTDEWADEITGFLMPITKTTPFYYTPPRETTPTKWVCEEWTDDTDSGHRKVTATFVESFLLD